MGTSHVLGHAHPMPDCYVSSQDVFYCSSITTYYNISPLHNIVLSMLGGAVMGLQGEQEGTEHTGGAPVFSSRVEEV